MKNDRTGNVIIICTVVGKTHAPRTVSLVFVQLTEDHIKCTFIQASCS
jgi:hypothetical protein